MKKDTKKNLKVQIFCCGQRVEEGIYCCLNCGKKYTLKIIFKHFQFAQSVGAKNILLMANKNATNCCTFVLIIFIILFFLVFIIF